MDSFKLVIAVPTTVLLFVEKRQWVGHCTRGYGLLIDSFMYLPIAAYKHSTMAIYNSRVVQTRICLQYNYRIVNYNRKVFIRLTIGC